jgi:hypothetical protein
VTGLVEMTAADFLEWESISEKVWMEQITRVMRLYGWRFYHTYDSRRSVPGFPDLIAVRPPRLIVVEAKRQSGRVRPEQAAWLQALGVVETVESYLWRPADRDAVLEILR